MFTLDQWSQYKAEVDERNSSALEECNATNKKIQDEFEANVDIRRKSWVAMTGSEIGFYRGMPGHVFPILEQATVEGCLNWLLNKETPPTSTTTASLNQQ